MDKSTQDWKKWQEKKVLKRKWNEEEVIRKLEKEKVAEEEEEKQRKLAEEKMLRKNRIGRSQTLSIAIPGSILDNAQSPELRTYLAGQIARAAVVFNVDEIVIFDESGAMTKSAAEGQVNTLDKKVQCSIQMARILQYLECPQYLRKSFFPHHKDLQYAGLLNPLDTPHHVKSDEDSRYREGVVLNKPTKPGKGSFVDVGLRQELMIDKQLRPGVRVTVLMEPNKEGSKKLKGRVVSPSTPCTDDGMYWGYSVRLARSLGAVFTASPYKGGYDVLIGTSERGSSIDEVDLPRFNHCLVVFGGVKGLEVSLETDQELKVDDPSLLFHYYLNACPNQGSHTIRTEEAVLITLSSLRQKILHSKSTES